jgi:hypothetical protein
VTWEEIIDAIDLLFDVICREKSGCNILMMSCGGWRPIHVIFRMKTDSQHFIVAGVLVDYIVNRTQIGGVTEGSIQSRGGSCCYREGKQHRERDAEGPEPSAVISSLVSDVHVDGSAFVFSFFTTVVQKSKSFSSLCCCFDI